MGLLVMSARSGNQKRDLLMVLLALGGFTLAVYMIQKRKEMSRRIQPPVTTLHPAERLTRGEFDTSTVRGKLQQDKEDLENNIDDLQKSQTSETTRDLPIGADQSTDRGLQEKEEQDRLAREQKEKEEQDRIQKEKEERDQAESARLEAERKAEEEKQAEEAERQAEAARQAEEERKAESARLEEERKAEEARIEAELQAEEARKAEEARIEAERQAEEERKAEEARLEAERQAEEARLEAERKAEEARLEAEESRLEAERRAEEERKAEEARIEAERQAEEERKAEEARLEAERQAEEERKAEEARIEAERKVAEEKVARQESGLCSSCNVRKPKNNFSQAQWKKRKDSRKCKDCVSGKSSPAPAEPAQQDKELPTLESSDFIRGLTIVPGSASKELYMLGKSLHLSERQVDIAVAAFNCVDVDGSGEIDLDELHSMYKKLLSGRMKPLLLKQYANMNFEIADKDKSGAIDVEEFLTIYHRLLSEHFKIN